MDDQQSALRVEAGEATIAALPPTLAGAHAISEHWFHSTQLASGELVEGGKKLPLIKHEQEVVFGPLDLAGRSVLDIGAWNGAFSFEAERRGAARVLATDHFCWLNPVWKGLETFLFVRRDLQSRAEVQVLEVDEVTLDRVGPMDVVIMLGVFYHLPNPLNCLEQLARIAQHCLVLETHCDCLDDPLPAMRYYPGTELNGDSTNWWAPNPACMSALLVNAGFPRVVVREHPEARGRFFFHAYKD